MPSRRAWIIACTLLAVGVLLRCALYFPVAAFPIDSDGVLAGLCGLRVLGGAHPAFFPGGVRLGAASCYVSAAYFHLFGAGRIGLALTGLTWGALYLVFSLLFLRAVLGPSRANTAFLFAVVPSAAFVTVTYVPWGYGEIVACSAAILWLAALWRSEGRFWQRAAFGFTLGLGIWFSLQTLMITLPAILWIAKKQGGSMLRGALPALLAAVLGALPFLIANASLGFASFGANWATRPVTGMAQIVANLQWLLTAPLPQLLFNGSGWLCVAIAVGLVLLGIGFVRARDRDASALLLLIVMATVLLYVFSQAGSVRGWTVRYVVPLYVVLPLILGIGAEALWRANRLLAVVAAGLVLIPNLLLYSLPGSAARTELTRQLNDGIAVRDYLSQNGVRLAYGDYFVVYHLNFDSLERIAAVPALEQDDSMGYADTLLSAPLRWALISPYPEQLSTWARPVAARGSVHAVGDVSVFIANDPRIPATLLAKLRTVSF